MTEFVSLHCDYIVPMPSIQSVRRPKVPAKYYRDCNATAYFEIFKYEGNSGMVLVQNLMS